MLEIKSNSETIQPNVMSKVVAPTAKPLVLGVITFVLLCSLFGLITFQRYELVREVNKKDAYEIVSDAKTKLQEALTYSLAATKTLTYFIDKDGRVNNFDTIAAQIFESGISIDALQLVPDGVVRYVYPLEGNEKVMGYNLLKDSTRNKEAFKTIEKREMFFGGPFPLRQGGIGVVGRLPVYRNDKFWGFSAVIIKLSTLLKAAGIDSFKKKGYYFQLSKINPDTGEEEFYLPVLPETNNNSSVSVNVPNGEWKLSVIASSPYNGFADVMLLTGLGFLFAVFAGFFVWRFALQPQKLNQLVLSQTSELKSSENKYRSLIERVSDAFTALDKNWNYTYANKKAGEILGVKPENLMGRNIWEIFPDAVNHPFYHAYQRAMETQEYVWVEDYYQPLGKWIENHIYPSQDGITVFFKDVTDIKEITLSLQQNEEKYRSLIEQASDGIVITDMEGAILEVNNSIKKIIGFGEEELIGYNIATFLPEEDNYTNPLRINELMQGRSLLYERRLLKKDGTILDVEVNSKMASSHTLIGFIRDISERKKVEAALKQSNERFELIAEGTNDAVWDHDFVKNETWGNNKLQKIYGLGSNEEKINFEMFLDHIHPEERAGIEERMNLAIENKAISISEIFRLKTGLDVYKTFYDRAYVKYDEEGNPERILGVMQDITDSENIKKQILKEKELSDSIINTLPGIFYLYNKAGNFLRWNTNFETVSGYTADEISQMHPLDFFYEDEKDMLTSKIANVFVAGTDAVEANFLLKNKEKIPYYFTGKAVEYEGEICLVGVGLDFSDKVKNEALIKESEEKFRIIIEQASDGVFIADEDTYFIDVNSAGCRMTGYSLEELKKLKFVDIIPTEDTFLNPPRLVPLNSGSAVINERRIKRKDGSVIEVEVSAKKMGDGRYQSFARDITARKKEEEILQQSEKKYKLLFYDNPLPMWMTMPPELEIIDVNDAALRQYGYSRETFLELNIRDLYPEEDISFFLTEMEKMKPDSINIHTWRHKKQDGSIIYVESYQHEIVHEGKKVWLGLSYDITEKYEAKNMLEKSYEDIRQLASNLQTIREDERTNIAREIHDELGQQLTGLKMDLHWLGRKIDNSDESVTQKMAESIELINATISTVRKIATDLRPSILDDLGLMPALEWQGEEFHKRSGTKVEFVNEAGDLPIPTKAATGIFRIYQELLTNVARHANANMVKAVLYKDKDRLYFNVSDNGIGFDLNNTSNKKTLGLLGIRERTLLIGGTCEFISKPGAGSTTIISIPLTTNI